MPAPDALFPPGEQLLFRSHPIPTWIYDRQTLRFVDVNEAAIREYGYTREEFLGMGIAHIRPAEDVPRLQHILSVPRTGWRRTGVWRHLAKNGDAFHVEITSHDLTVCDRPCVMVAALNVSERLSAEASVRRTEERLREAQRLAQMGSWHSNLEGTRVTWSDEMFRIMGRNPLDGPPALVDQRPMFVGDGWERLVAATTATRQSAAPYEVEAEIRRPDGSRRWIIFRGAATRDASGAIGGVHGTIQDVTDARQGYRLLAASESRLRAANEQLERSERKYRELVENLNEIVWSTDLDGILTYVSRNASAYGYHPEALIGSEYRRIVHPDDLPAVVRATATARNGAPVVCEYRALDAAGNIRYVRSSFRLVVEEGTPVALSGVLTDITEQRKAEEQLRTSQRLEAVGRLAGGIAHDFNNLLVVIQGYAELGVERLPESDPLRSDLQQILSAADRAASLTRQLLAFSRRQLLNPEVVNLNDVVTGMVSMLTRVIGEDIDFVTALDPRVPNVLIDAAQLEHAIMNLVVNARDAMPDGGRLRISTSTGGVSVDELSEGLRGQPLAVISVEDTGHGMDEATRSRIFEPFFTTKPQGKGTGLGLPMVYGFVKQSGGGLEVRSAPGQGSRFSIVLAAQPDEAAAPAPRESEPAVQRGSERVLVVEDDDSVRQLIERVLRSSGYSFISAATPAEAVAHLGDDSAPIDLLLTDVVMPQMNGAELAERALQIRPGLPVLYMSGYRDVPPAAAARMEGHGIALAKPFTAAELTSAIRVLLDRTLVPAPPLLATFGLPQLEAEA